MALCLPPEDPDEEHRDIGEPNHNDPKDPKKPDGNFKTPEEFKHDFDNKGIKGSRAVKNKLDSSVWEKDMSRHGGKQFKRWDSMKSWQRGDKPKSIWPNGSIRK